ncbi:MAG: hypothetical protein ACOCUU_00050 [Nanoarchaeota archaeon]
MATNYRRRVIEYFKKNLKKGYTSESLKWALINQGYTKTLVETSLKKAQIELAEEAPILKEKPRIKYEIIDEKNKPIKIKKPFFKKIKDLFR